MSFLRAIFLRPDYRSDATQFLNQLKAAKPELDAQQKAGRALLWDKSLNRKDEAAIKAGNVPQKPYVYQTNA